MKYHNFIVVSLILSLIKINYIIKYANNNIIYYINNYIGLEWGAVVRRGHSAWHTVHLMSASLSKTVGVSLRKTNNTSNPRSYIYCLIYIYC